MLRQFIPWLLFRTPAGSAVYTMLAGEPRIFTMASYHKTSIDKKLSDLRDKRLLTVSADQVSRLELIRKNQEIAFGRNKEEWQILKPKPLRADSSQVGELVGKLAAFGTHDTHRCRFTNPKRITDGKNVIANLQLVGVAK